LPRLRNTRSSARRGRRIAGCTDSPWRSIRMSLRSPTIRSIYPTSLEGPGLVAAWTNHPLISGMESPASTKAATPPEWGLGTRFCNASLCLFIRMSMPTNDRWRVDFHVDELLISLQHEKREHQVEPPAVLEQPEAQREQHQVEDQR